MRNDPEDIWTGDYAQNYESANYGKGLAARVMRRSHSLVEELFGSSEPFEKVLEVGAGGGIHLSFVRHQFKEYWLTDYSTTMLEGAAKSFSGSGAVKVQAEDATKLSFPDHSFDRLIATHVLEHLYRPHEVLREWARVVKPGGLISIVLPCDPGFLWRFGRYFGPRQKGRANGLHYDYLMAREHVNSINNLTAFIRYYFDNPDERWWPTRLPFADANLIYSANIKV